MGEAEKIAAKLTDQRKAALLEIGAAGEAGLGFGRCSLQARRFLCSKGLVERLPHKGGFFTPFRERLTPLGEAVRKVLERQS